METNQLQVQNDEVEIDLKEIFFVLLHKIWIIILAAVVCAVVAGVWTKTMITPLYESSSMMFILTKSTSITSLADIQMGSQLTSDYQVLVKSRPVLEEVIKKLKLDMDYEDLLKKVTLTNPADTRIITIKVLDPDPEMAKKITDMIAKVSASRIKDIMKTDAPSIVEQGHIAEDKTSPSTVKNVGIAGILGGFVAIFVIVLLFIMDDTVKSADDVEKYLGLTTLGTIPCTDKDNKQKKGLRKAAKSHK